MWNIAKILISWYQKCSKEYPWNFKNVFPSLKISTSRDQPKSAPYPRLKNSKKTSKCQVFSFTVLENRIFYEKITYSKNGPSGAPGPARASPWRAERGTLPKLSTFLSQLKGFCRKTSKNWKGEKFLFSEKISQCRKNWKGGPFGIFQHPFCRKTAKKWRGAKTIGRGDPLVWYGTRENRKNLFGSVR